MPLKSWQFNIDGQLLRAEIQWRYTGWSRRRVYLNHRRMIDREGWGQIDWPMQLRLDGSPSRAMEIEFESRWIGAQMDCAVRVDGKPYSLYDVGAVVEKQRTSKNGSSPLLPLVGSAGCLIFAIFVVAALSTIAALLPILLPIRLIAAWRDRHRLQKAGRCDDWNRLRKRALAEPSTLLVVLHGDSLETWWTPDDVLLQSPFPQGQAGVHNWRSGSLFAAWCDYRYIGRKTGIAIRTSISARDELRLPYIDDDVSACSRQFPLMQTVHLEPPFKSHSEQMPRILEIIGESVGESIPQLIEGLDDRKLRPLCLDALYLAGPAAAAALPALENIVASGPASDRTHALDTIKQLGPAGDYLLQSLANVDDPFINRPAQAALRQIEE